MRIEASDEGAVAVAPPPAREGPMIDARRFAGMAALAVGYYVGAEIGFTLTLGAMPVSTLWLPNAILLSALLLTPPHRWWLLIAAAVPAHLAAELRVGVPATMVLGWFISNSFEALLGAVLVRRAVGTPFRQDSFASVAVFLVAGALVPAGVSSFVDAGFVQLNGWGGAGYWSVWETRFRSNAVATLVVAPVILAWAGVRISSRSDVALRRVVEAVLLGVCLVGVGVAAFGWGHMGTAATPALLFVPIPVLLWAAIRFGPVGSGTALLVIVLLAFSSAARGHGPFLTHSPDENAFAMQALFGGVAVTMLFLSAIIEERRRALNMASLRGEQLQLALDGARMGSWLYRPETGMLELAAETRRIFGVSPEHGIVTRDRLLRAVHPEDRAEVAGAVRRASTGVAPLEIEFRLVGLDGGYRWVHAKGTLARNDEERPGSLVGLCADITPRKRAETINAGQQRILKMIASGSSLEAVLDEAVRFLEREVPGMAGSVLVLDSDGVHARHASAPNLPSGFVKAIDGAAIGPHSGAFGAAMYLRRPVFTPDTSIDARWRAYQDLLHEYGVRACWASPILSEQGQVLGAVAAYFHEPRAPGATCLDLLEVTTRFCAIVLDRKRLETEALERQRAVEHLSRAVMLGELTGTLAHELSQPLAAILNHARAGQRILDAHPERVSDINGILDDIAAADRRAADVLERIRSMLRKEPVKLEPVDLNQLVVSTLEMTRRDLAAHGVAIDMSLAPDLPPVLGDPVRLQQVVLNLVLNASDAMSDLPPGARRVSVRSGIDPATSRVELAISDCGPGIDVEPIDRIFEPFFTRKERGLGLGLAICRSIVVAHQGKLSARNEPEGGATFHLALPARLAQPARVMIPMPEPSAGSPT